MCLCLRRQSRVTSRCSFLSPDSASASHGSVRIFVEHLCEDFSRSSCWPLQQVPPFPRWPTLGPGRNVGASGFMVTIIVRRRGIGRRLIDIRDRQRALAGSSFATQH
jgi:hypothetical protein